MPELKPKVQGNIKVAFIEARQLTVEEHADENWHGARFHNPEQTASGEDCLGNTTWISRVPFQPTGEG